MAKLNLKEIPADIAEREWRRAQRAARKAKNRSTSVDSASPPPSKRTRKTSPSIGYDDVDDGEWVPPPSASKVDLDQLRATMEDERFRDKLADAMYDDSPYDAVHASFTAYPQVPNRWRLQPDNVGVDTSAMTEEEYAEFVRRGMWRRSHKAEFEERERKLQERRKKEEEDRKRRKQLKRLEEQAEKERVAKKEEKEKKRKRRAWEDYQKRWIELLQRPSSDTPITPITFISIPWPVFSKENMELSNRTISEFLLSPDHSKDLSRKQRIKEALRIWHPDRFVGRLMDNVVEEDRESVEEGVGSVVRILNAMAEEES
jgi:hypothetical protein